MDKYYQLLDRDPATISIAWKASHILSFIVIIISGFTAAYALGKTEEYFGQNCVLFASITFLNSSASTESTRLVSLRHIPYDSLKPFDMWYTKWGSVQMCNYCQFTPLCSTIFGLVWCTLFIICSRGGAGYMTDEIYRPWRLVYPAMIYTLVATAAMFGSLINLSAGIKHFCAEFEPIFHTTSCTDEIDKYTLSFSNTKKPLMTTLNIALTCSYICFFAGLAHLIIIILRIICIVDFQMIRITVTSFQGYKGEDVPEPDDNSPDLSINKYTSDKSASIFAFPVGPVGSTAYDTMVPIAESESLSDGLSPNPKPIKESPSEVLSPNPKPIKESPSERLSLNPKPIKESSSHASTQNPNPGIGKPSFPYFTTTDYDDPDLVVDDTRMYQVGPIKKFPKTK